MFRRRRKSPDIFERLENEAANELRLLEELGPQQFGTEHLMELHAEVCAQLGMQQRFQKVAMSIGTAGAGWFLLGAVAYSFGSQLPGVIALCLSSLCLMTYLGIMVYSVRRFQTKGHLDHTRLSIEDELRSRRDRQRKHMEDW